MDINKILTADYLDILFEGRNKKYGSYELRKNYKRRVLTAALIAIGVVGGLFATLLISPKEKEVETIAPIIKDVELMSPPPLDEKKPPPPPPPSTPPPPLKSTQKFTPPVIKKNEDVLEADKPQPIKPDENKVVGPANIKGSDNPDAIDPNLRPTSSGDGKGQAVIDQPPQKEQIFRHVEQMPEFGGDINKYLRDNIRYPQAALAQGLQGKVYLEFIVNEDGSISNVKVVRDIGGGTGEEAKRVVSKMKFKRGAYQNGHPVKMIYTLTVSFNLQ